MQVLIVDDDPLSAELVTAVVVAGGHEPVVAENALDASEQLAANPQIRLIISDMNMPLVSGIDLFRDLKQQGSTRPFILLTGDDPDALLAEEPGLDACLIKDFDLDETLLPLIEQVLAS